MYAFHYDHIKSTYGNRVVLLLTNTDSLVYSIETDDLYDDIIINALVQDYTIPCIL